MIEEKLTKSEKINRIIIFLLMIFFLFVSCDLENEPVQNKVKEYNAEILWNREIFGSSSYVPLPLVYEQFCYITTRNIPGDGSCIVKVNLDTGIEYLLSKKVCLITINIPES